jgi:hypothetical protein
MSTLTNNPRRTDPVHALVQLLKTRSYEEIRQRMYDSPPGTAWWSACKTELDIRNNERMATAVVDTARFADKMKASIEHLDTLTDQLLHAVTDMTELLRSARESGRRVEMGVYVVVAITILQLFYVAYQFAGKR